MPSIVQSLGLSSQPKTSELLTFLREQAYIYTQSSDPERRGEALAAAKASFDQFERSRVNLRPSASHSSDSGLGPAKLEALAKKAYGAAQNYRSFSGMLDFYRLAAPQLAGPLDGWAKQVAALAEVSSKNAAADARLVRVDDQAQTMFTIAKMQAAELVAIAQKRQRFIEQQSEIKRQALQALEARRQAYMTPATDTLFLEAGGCRFSVLRHRLEATDFFFPIQLDEAQDGAARQYSVPDMTARELRQICYFINHECLPGIEHAPELDVQCLRDAVTRHGPSSLLTYLDDPVWYGGRSLAPERIDEQISRAAGVYVAVPRINACDDMSQAPQPWLPAFYIRQNPVDDREQKRVEKLLPKSFTGYSPYSWFWKTAIEYCNALSLTEGLDVAYVLNEKHNATTITWNVGANGFRLPCVDEWAHAMDISCNKDDAEVYHFGPTEPLGDRQENGWGLLDTRHHDLEFVWAQPVTACLESSHITINLRASEPSLVLGFQNKDPMASWAYVGGGKARELGVEPTWRPVRWLGAGPKRNHDSAALDESSPS